MLLIPPHPTHQRGSFPSCRSWLKCHLLDGAFPDHLLKQTPPGRLYPFVFSLELITVYIILPINLFSYLLSVLSKVPWGQGPCPNHPYFVTLALSRVSGILSQLNLIESFPANLLHFYTTIKFLSHPTTWAGRMGMGTTPCLFCQPTSSHSQPITGLVRNESFQPARNQSGKSWRPHVFLYCFLSFLLT